MRWEILTFIRSTSVTLKDAGGCQHDFGEREPDHYLRRGRQARQPKSEVREHECLSGDFISSTRLSTARTQSWSGLSSYFRCSNSDPDAALRQSLLASRNGQLP
jgi:hypothetical protein